MALYIHPENQKLLWSAIQTSPLFQYEYANALWFRSVIQHFHQQLETSMPELTPETLRQTNMDTILYMIRDLKTRQNNSPSLRSVPEREVSGTGTVEYMVRDPESSMAENFQEPTHFGLRPSCVAGSDFRTNSLERSGGEMLATRPAFAPNVLAPADMDIRRMEALGSNPYLLTPSWEQNYQLKGSINGVEDRNMYSSSQGRNVAEQSFEQSGRENDMRQHYEAEGGYLPSLHKIIPSPSLHQIPTPILTKCLNIDTRFRDNLYTTTSSNFTFNLPTTLKKVISMQLTAYELPITFYGISSSYGNNFLNLAVGYDMNDGNGPQITQKTIIVADGNYSATDLIHILNTALRPVDSFGALVNQSQILGSGVGTGSTTESIFNCVQFTFDITSSGSGSAKLTIGAVDAPGFAFAYKILNITMDFTLDIHGNTDTVSVTSKIGWNLGFIQPLYDENTQYISDTLPEPASMRYIYLVVNDFNNSVSNHFVGAFSNWILNDNILARIPVNAQYFNILMENDLSQHTEPRRYFGPVDIQRLQLQLLDDHGRVLDVNKANYSLCLTFKTVNE